MRTDPLMVREFVAEIAQKHAESRKRFLESGIVKARKATAAERREGKTDFMGPKGVMRYATDKKVLKALVEKAYAGAPPTTEKGQISTSRDTLAESGDPVLEDFAESGENEKLFSTYVDVLERGARVPITPRYQVFLASDRVSCYDPNLQQLPRAGKVREAFIPRPGWLFNSVDYAALELCTVSQICLWWFGHSAMGDAINAGQDLHTRLAASFKGISYDAAMALKKAKDKEILGLRQVCKSVNFGLGGLMGVPRLVFTARKDGVRLCESAGVSESCARNPKVTEYKGRTISPTCEKCLHLGLKFQELYFSEWSEMRDYHAACIRMAEQGELQNLPLESMSDGHMLRLEASAGAVCNHFFQNLAARGAKAALWALSDEAYTDRKSVLFNNLRPVVFVHDEIISEVREGVAHEAAFRQAEIMVAAMQEHVPGVKITAKPALMRRWFKGAEDVYMDGRLVVWEP